MSKQPKTLNEKIIEADILASRYLGNFNEEFEKNGNTPKAEKLIAKSQFWLDRYNKLAGNS